MPRACRPAGWPSNARMFPCRSWHGGWPIAFRPRPPTILIRADFPANFPVILADETRMEQVLSNLISNAIKYAPDGEIHIGGSIHPELIVICVTDEGPGIASEDIPHIFDRFYRAPEMARQYQRRRAGFVPRPRHHRGSRRAHLGGPGSREGRPYLLLPARGETPSLRARNNDFHEFLFFFPLIIFVGFVFLVVIFSFLCVLCVFAVFSKIIGGIILPLLY